MNTQHAARLTLAGALVCLCAALAASAHASRPEPASASAPQTTPTTFNLADFGARGDGVTDDGPAFQAALDALMTAGGGTLRVPAGRFVIATPVVAAAGARTGISIEMRGVESSTPVPPPTAPGNVLSTGLDLASEIYPRTGSQIAFNFDSQQSVLVKDIAFVGTPEVITDALVTLNFGFVPDAVIRHCEFYGLSSQLSGGAIVQNWSGGLTIQQSKFLGSTANSGLYAPVVQNYFWESITVEETIFIDYGQRPELYAKTGYGAPISWINVGHATPPTPGKPRREAVIRNVFFDEGGWYAVSAMPARTQSPPVPLDLFYVTGCYTNVSNFNTTGFYITGVRQVLVEDSIFTWSRRADSAIHVFDAQDAILDRITTREAATRLRADHLTQRLTVIDSTYTDLASAAAQTLVLTPATPDDDHVRYVRARFGSALGRVPDAAAHYYWSRKLLDCGADTNCIASQRAALALYLTARPAANFLLSGRATDERGQPLAGINVTLTGLHLTTALTTTTGADGSYSFGPLPTSGAYNVTVGTKRHYTFDAPTTQTVVTPAGNQVVNFPARLNRHAIGGRLLDERGRAIQGATLTLSGAQSAKTTSDANGDYTFASLPAGGNYTVNVSSTRHTFTNSSQSFTDLDANRTANFNGTALFFKLNGQLLDSTNQPLNGHTVLLSGGQSATVTTDAQGNFIFVDLPRGGSYTVTPAQLLGNLFTPASQSFNNLTNDQTAVFNAVPTNYKIAGRVTSGAAGLAGVTLTLSGSKSGTATTDADGNYSFDVPVHGNYVIEPAKTHYTFDRASASFTGVTANQTADFVATLNRYRIAGRITDRENVGLAGVTVALTGTQAFTTTTDAGGNYSLTNLPAGGNYTVAASKVGYAFNPASVAVNNLGSDQTLNFTGTLGDYTLRGRVTSGGNGLASVVVTLTGSKTGTATTDAGGNYSFSIPAEGSYTVTPTLKHYTFAPASASFANLGGDRTADFIATLNRHTLSGRVAYANDAGIPGVTVALAGTQTGAATTDAQGNFSFPNLPAGGSYTLTPTLAHHTFAPASQNVGDLSDDTRAAFTAAFVNYRIAGRITEKNGIPLAGVEVTLEGAHALLGAQAGKVTTGADGSYTFTVPALGDYTVTPLKKSYAFDPAVATFDATTSDQTTDFVARLRTILSFSAMSYTVAEGGGSLTVTITREGDTTTEASVVYEGHSDTAKIGSDFVASIGLVTFAPGETSKTFTLFITDDGFAEGPEHFTLTLTPRDGAVTGDAATTSVTISDNDATTATINPIDDEEFFVRGHYRDFFSREPDAAGLRFWTDEIRRCGANAQCREARRINVSAAFFLSIEFKETGYLIYRLYRATYGRAPARVGEFMLDTRVVSDGVVVGAAGWAERLAANRRAFLETWTQRPEFEERLAGLDDARFVQTLFTNMGVTPTDARRSALLARLAAGAARAEVINDIIDDAQFNRQEFNRAFVLMQYFGYLRRNANDSPDSDLSGYNHWLAKLNEFGGDYERAEMVRAFLSSAEYRGRFGN